MYKEDGSILHVTDEVEGEAEVQWERIWVSLWERKGRKEDLN